VVDPEASMEDLLLKISKNLRQSGVQPNILRIVNTQQSTLPRDELVGDMLRDGEEVIVILAEEMPSGEEATFQGPVEAELPKEPGVTKLPGPQEMTIEEMEMNEVLNKESKKSFEVGGQLDTDWMVEGLTPKLREYVVCRFQESHVQQHSQQGSHLEGASITILMKPVNQRVGREGSSTLPIQFNIARVDLVDFEKLSERCIEESRARKDYLTRSMERLSTMIQHGKQASELAPALLPYEYDQVDKAENFIKEADENAFGQVEGFRPVIIVDTFGAVADHLNFIKASLKRLLYSYLSTKSKFNFVQFASEGHAIGGARPWARAMVPPTQPVLRQCEDWIDVLRPTPYSDMLSGIRAALSMEEADTVYLLCSGLDRRTDVRHLLQAIRTVNVRDLPIHVIAVEPKPEDELVLRHLAEGNHGVFRLKSFQSFIKAPKHLSTTAMQEGMAEISSATHNMLSISGQQRILEVMQAEATQTEAFWLAERKCVNRLLLSTMTQGAVPDPATHRTMQRTHWEKENLEAGGSVFPPRPGEVQLKDLFGANGKFNAGGPQTLSNGGLPSQPPLSTTRRCVPNQPQDWKSRTRLPPPGPSAPYRPAVGSNPWETGGKTVRAADMRNAVFQQTGGATLRNPSPARGGATIRTGSNDRRRGYAPRPAARAHSARGTRDDRRWSY